MSRGRAETKSPTSCRTRVTTPWRKQLLPQRGQGRCLKLRLRRTIFAGGRSSGLVIPSVGSATYCPGPDTAMASLARNLRHLLACVTAILSLMMLQTLLFAFIFDLAPVCRHRCFLHQVSCY